MQTVKLKAAKLYSILSNTSFPIPFFDAYKLTHTRDSCGIGMMLFSSIYHRSVVYFGVVISLGSDLETRYHTKRCLEIIKGSDVEKAIIKEYANWGMNYVLVTTLLNDDIFIKSKYINFSTPYLFETLKINDFSVGYQNVMNKYPNTTVNLVGLPEVEGVESSLLFIDDDIIVYQNNKPINMIDQYGLGVFIEENKNTLLRWAKKVSYEHGITEPLAVDFIWAGGQMRPYSSVADIEKFMVVYFIGYYHRNTNSVIWKEPIFTITDKHIRIFDIRAIKQYRVTLTTDEDNKENNIALLKSFNKEIENNCPVGQYFTKLNRHGAGIIWHVEFKESAQYYFIIRNKNRLSNEKTTANKVDTFIHYAITQARLEQAAKTAGIPSPKNLSYFISELYSAVLLAEKEYIKKNVIDLDALEQEVWKVAARWYRKQYFSK